MWKNYDDLEENLCVEELIAILNALREREKRERVFLAAIQGIDLDDNNKQDEGDITELSGYQASEAGFGINMGLGYVEVGGE
jgi:hypothetical protein